jgi:hypothetical protein
MGAFFPDCSEVGVDKRLVERSVTEVGRDVPNTNTIFEQVRRITMTQSVRCDALLQARSSHSPLERILDGGATHRLGGGTHGFLLHAFFGDLVAALGLAPTTTNGGKEKFRMLVPSPPLAKLLDHLLRDGHVTRLASLALRHEQTTSIGIDVRGLNVDTFGEAKTASVDER